MLLIDVELNSATNPSMGLGVFTKQFISSGSLIWEFTQGIDIKLSVDDFEKLNKAQKKFFDKYGWYQNKYYYSSCDLSNFINHSNSPNLACKEMYIYAMQDINIDEELFCNYKEFDENFYIYEHTLIPTL